jgi:hypothetical protein
MAETRRGGFHALEKKIHDIEDQDRAGEEQKAKTTGKGKVQAPPDTEGAAERRPPPAHDE